MRFTKKKDMKKLYHDKSHKIETKFLWLPVTIKNETRWLETATIKYRVNRYHQLVYGYQYYWELVKFIDK